MTESDSINAIRQIGELSNEMNTPWMYKNTIKDRVAKAATAGTLGILDPRPPGPPGMQKILFFTAE